MSFYFIKKKLFQQVALLVKACLLDINRECCVFRIFLGIKKVKDTPVLDTVYYTDHHTPEHEFEENMENISDFFIFFILIKWLPSTLGGICMFVQLAAPILWLEHAFKTRLQLDARWKCFTFYGLKLVATITNPDAFYSQVCPTVKFVLFIPKKRRLQHASASHTAWPVINQVHHPSKK